MDNWTPEQEKECARLWCVEGLPYRDIGYRVDRKKSSVFRCIKRLGLKGRKGDISAFEDLYGGEAVSMPFQPVRLNVEPPGRITADQIDAISFHWSDVHFPFQDQRVLDIMYQLVLELQPNIVVDHGDLLDFWQLSTHRPPEEKKLTYWQIELQEAINQAGQHLATVASLSQQDRRIWKMGNHEDRWNRVFAAMQQDYKVRHILALDKIKEILTLDYILGVDSLGYESYPYIGGETVTLFDRLVIAHGHVANKWAARSMLTSYGKSVMFGHCFSEDTQILTKDGWKGYDSLEEGQVVAGWKDGKVNWEPIEKVWVHDASDFPEMVKIYGERSLDLLVTPEHGIIRWGVLKGDERKKGSRWVKVSAEEASEYATNVIPVSGDADFAGTGLTSDEIRLIAYAQAEGHFMSRYHGKEAEKRGSGPVIRVRIGQNASSPTRDNIRSAIEGSGARYSERVEKRKGGMMTSPRNGKQYPCRDDMALFDVKYSDFPVPIEKYNVPDEIYHNATREEFVEYFTALAETDGEISKWDYMKVYTNSEHFASQLQAMAAVRSMKAKVSRNHSCWLVSLTSRSSVKIQRSARDGSRFSRVAQVGSKVWCVTVPSGAVIVRRNGQHSVASNTHRHQVFCNRTMKGAEAGFNLPCCCTLDVHYTPMTDWQQGFAVVHWHKDADRGWLFNVDTVMVHDGAAVYNGKVYK